MKLETAQKWLKDSVGHRNKWRSEAKKAYDFVAGEQWSPEERQVMEDLMRPVTVFNKIAPIVDAIVGHETANRQAVAYLPRQVGATAVAEVLSAAAKWVRDECGAEGEESDAFNDSVVTGEGWMGTEPDYDEDPDGQILMERVDPREMDIDPACHKKNYKGAKWLCRTRKWDRARAEENWPGANFEPTNRRDSQEPIDVISAAFYHEDSGAQGRSGVEGNLVLIHDFQWWECEPIYRIKPEQIEPNAFQAMSQVPEMKDALRPSETGLLTFTAEQWKVLLPFVQGKPIEQRRKVYKRMFWSGMQVLEEKDCPTKDSFTYHAITAKRDHQKHMWYGIVRAMRDPQLWSNKFMSLSLEIIGTSAKGGALAEIDAFHDPRKAEEDWADPSKLIYMKAGAVAGKKVIGRAEFASKAPPGMQELMMYANQSLNDVAGVNPAVMGFSKELDVSGVLEQTRLHAGLNLLSYLFDALRRYRKSQGVLLMAMIREYIPQGRLVKIEGPEGAKYVPLAFDPAIMKYDVVVDEAPTAPNIKVQTWETFLGIARIFPPQMMTPQFLLPLLKYSPFPSALVQEWTKAASSPQAQQHQQQMQQLQTADATGKVRAVNAKADLDEAKARKEGAPEHIDPMEMASKVMDFKTAQVKANAEVTAANAKAHQSHLEAQGAALQHHLDTQGALRDAALAEQQAQREAMIPPGPSR
ncbi:MAG: hypothetical protein ACRD3F_15205 [Acidobacteriaceae bacterium]